MISTRYLKTDGDMVENDTMTAKEVDLFSRIGSLKPEMKVLDLCCGQGRHSLELASKGFQSVTGFDYSQFLLDTAKKRLAEKRATNSAFPDVTFVQGDARALPFDDSTFDAVLCLGNSFGYFTSPGDDRKVLREVARVVKVRTALPRCLCAHDCSEQNK